MAGAKLHLQREPDDDPAALAARLLDRSGGLNWSVLRVAELRVLAAETLDQEKIVEAQRRLAAIAAAGRTPACVDVGASSEVTFQLRMNVCGRRGCRCAQAPPAPHGPYLYAHFRGYDGRSTTRYLGSVSGEILDESLWLDARRPYARRPGPPAELRFVTRPRGRQTTATRERVHRRKSA